VTHLIPPRLGYVVNEPTGADPTLRVFLMHLPDGEPLALVGSAALIWALAADGEPDGPAALAELLSVPVDEIEDATRAYLDTLVVQALLIRAAGDEGA